MLASFKGTIPGKVKILTAYYRIISTQVSATRFFPNTKRFSSLKSTGIYLFNFNNENTRTMSEYIQS